MAGLHGLEDFRMWQMHPSETANRFAADETHDVSLGEAEGAGLEFADSEFRTLQIYEDADRARELCLDLADEGVRLAQYLRRRMAHIDAKHIGAGYEQRTDHFFVVGGRTEGGDDLDSAIAPH